jgi:hypothetical protein
VVESVWNVMAHGNAREGKWRGNRRMEWVGSALPLYLGIRSIQLIQWLPADPLSSTACTRLNWLPCRFKWTCPFPCKTKSGLCACAVTFQTDSNTRTFQATVRQGAQWRTESTKWDWPCTFSIGNFPPKRRGQNANPDLRDADLDSRYPDRIWKHTARWGVCYTTEVDQGVLQNSPHRHSDGLYLATVAQGNQPINDHLMTDLTCHITWLVPVVASAVLSNPDDGCKERPKHVEKSCSEIK